jgi:hypothetical protein
VARCAQQQAAGSGSSTPQAAAAIVHADTAWLAAAHAHARTCAQQRRSVARRHADAALLLLLPCAWRPPAADAEAAVEVAAEEEAPVEQVKVGAAVARVMCVELGCRGWQWPAHGAEQGRSSVCARATRPAHAPHSVLAALLCPQELTLDEYEAMLAEKKAELNKARQVSCGARCLCLSAAAVLMVVACSCRCC